jgi:excisionase family DNA binding protein
MAEPAHYLHQAAAARYLGMSARTLRRRTVDGAIRAHKSGGRTIYSREDLDAFAQREPVEPGANPHPPWFRRDDPPG